MLPPIAAIAACGSLVTAVKSAWELRRMVKNKRQKRRDEDEALDILDELEDAYEDGLLTEVDYSRYYSRYLESVAEGDLTGLRKLRMHIDIVAVRQKMVPRSRSLEVARTQAQSATSRRGAPPSIPSPSQCSSSEAYSSAQSVGSSFPSTDSI
ncbi:hypothetical protein BDY21DRAFT_47590 [Lineolata rhizophorae]|uniref:Uncharacterized protein n=1 Tax=Lineolata rhizophorae TaxID=578093 RepID=A0A6A6NYF5_9PEZI|nr:hypothetical protein BDY21DRAFT_47590 [Lineolata rhizophorae]